MFKIIDFNHRLEWDEIVRGFTHFDVYYLSGYLAAFQIHGDGEPILAYYQGNGLKGICAFMLRDITSLDWAKAYQNKAYDVVTPYGYGGWLLEGDKSNENLQSFWDEYVAAMKEHDIVDAFTRWCPWLINQDEVRGFSNVIDLGNTIFMDTTSEDVIFLNIKSKDRATIRKAIKNGVMIERSDDLQLLEEFRKIYNATMDKDHAEEYYYFKPEFYQSIARDMKGHWKLFYAMHEGQMIAASIILFANGKMHYHLSGSKLEFRSLNATNLILYEVAKYASTNGYKLFHLGGGVGSGTDPLYKFKKTFNKNGDLQFSISKDTFNQEIYDELVELRRKVDSTFDNSTGFFPAYRS